MSNPDVSIEIKQERRVILQGVVGKNCGIVKKYEGEDKRLIEKGFTVSDGIPTLRGYAKISDLAAISHAKYNSYQREKNESHVSEIKTFLETGKAEAKLLPEVVLSVDKPENIILKKYSHKSIKSDTAIGAIQNLDYYSLIIEGLALSRVDGNHRLEAGKDLDYYIPFSVVLWNVNFEELDITKNLIPPEINSNNSESEAFLFYLLNNTAKKLELEENYKGLVKENNWKDDELCKINENLPLLRHYFKTFVNNKYCKNEFINYPLSQLGEILNEMDKEDMTSDILDKYLNDTLDILKQIHKFTYLKSEFKDIFFQLVFYSRHKNSNRDEAIKILELIDNWLKRYKYSNLLFTKADKIYNIVTKYLRSSPKYIFVAMEYKSADTVKDYNDVLKRTVVALNNMGSNSEIENYPIMTGDGKSFNITKDIYNKIDECSIFIADITEANPNVMYELGIAHTYKKPIILLRKKSEEGKEIKVPSDIISEYYYLFDSMNELEEILFKNIKIILEKEYGTVFPG